MPEDFSYQTPPKRGSVWMLHDGTAIHKNKRTPFDLTKDSEALMVTDVYWILNEARFE